MARASGSRSTRCCSPASARRSPRPHTGPKPSPREVQALIRSGLSAEDVAQVTGASVDYIRRFEGPVLAEREHVVTSALAVPVHVAVEVDPADDPATFGSVIRDRLAKLGAHGERWASWKDEERGWIVKLEFTADTIDHDARWGFEPRKQSLHPHELRGDDALAAGRAEGRAHPAPARRRAPSPTSRASTAARSRSTRPITATSTPRRTSSRCPTRARTPATSSPAAARAAIKRADEPTPTLGETADLLEALRRRRGEREAAVRRARAAAAAAPAGPGAGRRDPAAGARAEVDRGEARHGGPRPLGRQVDDRTRRARLAAPKKGRAVDAELGRDRLRRPHRRRPRLTPDDRRSPARDGRMRRARRRRRMPPAPFRAPGRGATIEHTFECRWRCACPGCRSSSRSGRATPVSPSDSCGGLADSASPTCRPPSSGPCDWWSPFSDHDVSPGRVPLSISGWRFQASADDGETHVFDVEHDGAHWHLVRVFD